MIDRTEQNKKKILLIIFHLAKVAFYDMIMKDPNRAIDCCRQRLCAS